MANQTATKTGWAPDRPLSWNAFATRGVTLMIRNMLVSHSQPEPEPARPMSVGRTRKGQQGQRQRCDDYAGQSSHGRLFPPV